MKFILSAFADEIDSDLSVQMDTLSLYGIKFIEMRGVNGKNITEYSTEEARQIRKQLNNRGFKISAVGSPIGKIDIKEPFEQHFQLFLHTLDLAEILGAGCIRIFSFYVDEGMHETVREEVLKRLHKMVSEAETRGIVLLHENEKGIYGDTAERCRDLLDALEGPHFRATFDPANFVQCGADPVDSYEILKNEIKYFHVKDAIRDKNNNVPAGYGDGEIKTILKKIMAGDGEMFVSLEPHLTVFEGFGALEKTDGPEPELSDDGIEKFKIAYEALQKILEEIKAEV